jgi:hypothetical protein
MRKRRVVICACVVLAAAAVAVASGMRMFKGLLTGFQEVPAISTAAGGEFNIEIGEDENSLSYQVTYSNLEADATQSHIHFGQPGVAGGISVWLCSNLASPPTPAGTQACPLRSGTITGTITAANVIGPAGQGIAPGEFAELVRAMRAGQTYVNVHSTKFPTGEIRGQIDAGNKRGKLKGRGDDGDDDHDHGQH